MPGVAAVTAAEGSPSERWLARASLTFAGLAVVIVGVFAGLRSVAMLAVGLAAAALSLAAGSSFPVPARWLRLNMAEVARQAVANGADLLGLDRENPAACLGARADGVEITAPQALLVANNPYGTGGIVGLSHRARLDGGLLGVVGITVDSARQAAGLLRGTHGAGLARLGEAEGGR